MRLHEFSNTGQLYIPKNVEDPIVSSIQSLLVNLGFKLPQHGVDGIYQEETKEAVRQFQEAANLPQTGITDQHTIDVMNSILSGSTVNQTGSFAQMATATPDFKPSDFKCKCGCGAMHVKVPLLQLVQSIHDHFKKPVTITSGVRCRNRNAKARGARQSRHLYGEAADIKVTGVSPKQVAAVADTLLGQTGGVKAYPSFTHLDIRKNKWRG